MALTACGNSEEAEDSPIRVVDTAGMPSAFLQYGVDRGHFEDAGIDVEVEPLSGGGASIPVLISGEVQFAGADAVSALVAADQGLPIQFATGGTRTSDIEEDDFARVFVSADSDDFTEPADLAEATFAVNNLENINDIALMTALENQGVTDFDEMQFVELDFPEMAPAVESGEVDAALMIEPFVSLALEQGLEPIMSPYVQSRPDLMIGAYLTTEDFAEEDPETVETFREGITATAEDISEDPDSFREALPELSDIDAELAQEVHLPHWSPEADRESLEFTSEQMVKFEKLREPADLDHLLIFD